MDKALKTLEKELSGKSRDAEVSVAKKIVKYSLLRVFSNSTYILGVIILVVSSKVLKSKKN